MSGTWVSTSTRESPSRVGADYETIQRNQPDNVDVTHPLLPEFLTKSLASYRVLPEPELVDGHRCWIVEWPGMDRIWVDPECGFVIRRRIYHWGPGKPLRCDVVQKDIREVRPGLWIAFQQIVENYANPARSWRWRWGASSTLKQPAS